MRRKGAYYSRNGSYSRSANAEWAEEENRFPRSRAAKHLGVSVKAFDAGCLACGYVATEWHHVGKYAAMVDYYDCEALADDPLFWEGAAGAYKSAKKRDELLAAHSERIAAQKQERIDSFREEMIKNRDCSKKVRRHNGRTNWVRRCLKAGIVGNKIPAVGDEEGFLAAVAVEVERRRQVEKQQATLMSLLKQYFTADQDVLGRSIWRCGEVTAFMHDAGVNVGPNRRSDGSKLPKGHYGLNMSVDKSVVVLRRVLGLE